jgi:Tol biopolymer transport system component
MDQRTARAALLLSGILTSTVGIAGSPQVAVGAFPGENGLVTFVSAGVVRTLDLATGEIADIAPAYSAAWSPDGQRVALLAATGGLALDILVVAADGSGAVNLTEDVDGQVGEPTWSPAGDEIAYAELSGPVLVVMNADGSDKRRIDLSGEFFSVSRPRWSPDGDRIVFVGNWPVEEFVSSHDLFSIEPSGSGLTQLTFAKDGGRGGDYAPDWAPDGSRIAWEARFDAGTPTQIWVMNADGSDPHPLVTDAVASESPVWSPDGTAIAFNTADATTIRMISADGSGPADILTREDRPFLKDWQPVVTP